MSVNIKRRANDDVSSVGQLQDHPDAKKPRDELKQEEVEETRSVESVMEGSSEIGMAPNRTASTWSEMPTEMQTLVVSYLDNRAKKALRATCLHNYQVVNKFRFLKFTEMYTCVLEEEKLGRGKKRWWMKFCLGLEEKTKYATDREQSFDTYKDFIDMLHNAFEMIECINKFHLKVIGFSEPFQLMRGRRKVEVKKLHFEMYNRQSVVNGFLSQFKKTDMDYFEVRGENLGLEVFRTFEPLQFDVHKSTPITDAQLLNMRASLVEVKNASRITARGLKAFLKRMLAGGTPKLHLTELSQEVLDLFDYKEKHTKAHVYIYSPNSRYFLKLQLLQKPRKGPVLSAERIEFRHPNLHNVPLVVGPRLQRFVHAVEMGR